MCWWCVVASAVYHVMNQVCGPTALVDVEVAEGDHREGLLGVLVQLGILLSSDDGSSVSPGYPIVRTAVMQVSWRSVLSLARCDASLVRCSAIGVWAVRFCLYPDRGRVLWPLLCDACLCSVHRVVPAHWHEGPAAPRAVSRASLPTPPFGCYHCEVCRAGTHPLHDFGVHRC